MKDLHALSYFLGLEVSSKSDGYYLSQAKYVYDLSRADIPDNKTSDTPLEENVATDGEPLTNATLYWQLVGRLVYLTITRPDISYAVHLDTPFMFAPRSCHFVALHILRYVKGTMFYGLHFSSSLELRAFFDVDCAKDPSDHHSITRYCFFLCDSLSLVLVRNNQLLLIPVLRQNTKLSLTLPLSFSSCIVRCMI